MNAFVSNSCRVVACGAIILSLTQCSPSSPGLRLEKGSHILLVGNNLCSRMMNFGFFETELHLRYPDSVLYIRNMCDGGNTPGFRPHAGRVSPWAFSGAEQFQTELTQNSGSQGHFETPDEWLTRLEVDIIIACFGYNESFRGQQGIETFKAELQAFVRHSISQNYNGESPPQLALVSPIAFQDLSHVYDLPDGQKENLNLALYTKAIKEVAELNKVHFVDVFTPSKRWFSSGRVMTIDGSQLDSDGYSKFSSFLADAIFGGSASRAETNRQMVRDAVIEKNWFWHNDFKTPNGVHVFGRRYNPFGPDNYPAELVKIREMTALRDQAIWHAAKGEEMDLADADQKTSALPQVQTNYRSDGRMGDKEYLYGQQALDRFTLAPGYDIQLFASEREFPDLANPVQLSFDSKGRLWVAVMPSYPHYRPGDEKPNDKLLILEDTNLDGKADKQTIFADQLHLPLGFELAEEGVYVTQGTNFKLLTDTNGDDKADQSEILLSGFDDHDTHHGIGAYCADPSGAIYMGEGVFLHSNVETPYGPIRGTNGGFFRYNPARRHLERTAQLAIPNPWGTAFDEWGQNFFAIGSGPDVLWMMPGSIRPRYGVESPKSTNLIEEAHLVRPTAGLEFVSSSHFPDEVQGDLLINNTIGFLGTKQHIIEDDGTGFRTSHRQDLVSSTDLNFRPVDLEFAPDGSLYLVDWHNVLVGHMQHNARDPLRDHVHGRIYRITYPARPLVEPAKVHGAGIARLFDNLKLPEYRTRYRSRRELRGRDPRAVLDGLAGWVRNLDGEDPKYEHHLLEALWVSWGLNQVDQEILRRLFESEDFRVRAGAVRVIRYSGHQLEDQVELLMQAAQDDHGRVRLEAITAASWLDKDPGLAILAQAGQLPLDPWILEPFKSAEAHLNGRKLESKHDQIDTELAGGDLKMYKRGKEIYQREGYCGTCHQPDGKGLEASGFPPLLGTRWVLGSKERLIKITLHGAIGPMEVLGNNYPGQVPMTAFKGLLRDGDLACVLTYIRNSFGNKASVVFPGDVAAVRTATQDKTGFYTSEELLEENPFEEVQ